MNFYHFINLSLLLTLISFANVSLAGVYKCTFWDKETKQNRVVYTDTKCAESNKQTLTDIQTSSNKISTRNNYPNDMQSDAIDQQVTRAVLNRDFELAKSLATTKEHWRLIAIAEGSSATPVATVRTEEPHFVQASQEEMCQEARGDFDTASRLYWRDSDLIATKKSMMFAACGVPEPEQYTLVGAPYGYGMGWRRPYYNHHRLGHHQAKGYKHQYQNGGSLNLGYKSKHMSLRANSFDQR